MAYDYFDAYKAGYKDGFKDGIEYGMEMTNMWVKKDISEHTSEEHHPILLTESTDCPPANT